MKVKKPRKGGDFGFAVNYVLDDMGESPFGWPAPNGFPEVGAAWASAGRMRGSWGMHHVDGRRVVAVDGDEPEGSAQLPARGPGALRQGRRQRVPQAARSAATADCIQAAAQLTEFEPTATISSREDFGDWRAVPLIATVLNSPEHLRK